MADSGASRVIAITIVITILSTLCVIFRFTIMHLYRTRTPRAVLCHGFLFAACFMDWAANSITVWTLQQEMKQPELFAKWAIPESPRKALFAGNMLYLLSLILVKAGYLVYFSELLVGVRTRKRWFLYVAIAIWAMTGAIAVLLQMLWCRPLSGNWRVTDFVNCPSIYNHDVFLITFSLMIVSDIAILAVPLSIITTLKFKRSRRLQFTGITFVFAIGILSAAATTVKLAVVEHAVRKGGVKWSLVRNAMVWSQIELFAAMLAIALPTFGWALGMMGRKWGLISTTEPSGGPGSGNIIASSGNTRRQNPAAGQQWVTSETDLVHTLRRASEGSGDSRKGDMVLMEMKKPRVVDSERGVEIRGRSLDGDGSLRMGNVRTVRVHGP